MEQIRIHKNLKLSRIVHGYWRMTDWNMSNQEILNLVETCLELGITTVDHADIYGDYTCESIFGEVLALKPELRCRLKIITKCGVKLISENRPEYKIKYYDTSKAHIIQSVENSLRNLKTDYIDILLIHRPDPFINPEEVADAFNMLRTQGKVLNFGVSNFKPFQFNMLSSYLNFPLITNQIEISPIYLNHFEIGTIAQCQEKRISPMAWSPLAGGRLFSAHDERTERVRNTLEKIRDEVGASSTEQIVYAWILNHPAKIIPIVGSKNIERIKLAVKSIRIKLSTQQWFEIWQSSIGREVD